MNSSFLQKNKSILHQFHPELAKRVEVHSSKITLTQDSEDKWNIAFPQNRFLYSQTLKADLEEFKNALLSLQGIDVLVWYGLGLGYHLQTALDNFPQTKFYNLIVEPNLDYFLAYLSINDCELALKNPKNIWLVGLNPNQVQVALYETRNLPQMVTAIYRNVELDLGLVEENYKTKFRTKWSEFVSLMGSMTNVDTFDSYYGLCNFMQNLSHVSTVPFVNDLSPLFKNKPGILVGAGPSLKASLPYLKKIRDKAVVFGASSALRLLQENGLSPHLTGCLERMPSMIDVYQNVDTSQMINVGTPILVPEIYKIFKGKHIHLVRDYHFLPWVYPGLHEDYDGPVSSVSLMGLFVLAKLGCNPIYLLGQDCAFDPSSSKTHVDGYDYKLDKNNVVSWGKTSIIKVEGNNNHSIDTQTSWFEFAGQISLMANKLNFQVVNVIPKEFGMKLENTPVESPDYFFNETFDEKFKEDLAVKLKLEKELARIKNKAELGLVFSKAKDELRKLIQLLGSLFDKMQMASSEIEMQNYFPEVESTINSLLTNSLWKQMIYWIVFGRWMTLKKKLAELNTQANTPEILRQKAAVLGGMLSEIIVKCRMALVKLEAVK